MGFWPWVTEHWFLAFLLFFTAISMSGTLISRTYRLIMVLVRGWPTAPLMDADGDIVHPNNEK